MADVNEAVTAPTADEPRQDGLPQPRRFFSALAIWLAIIATVLDLSLVTLALPLIARDTGADPHSVTWVVGASQVALAVGLLPAARLGDLFGFRRVYAIGLTAFMVGSVGCALMRDLTSLSIMRFVQGLGAAGVMALNGGMVRHTYPLALLGRGISYNALVIAVTAAIGPVIAAAVLTVAPWPALFLVSIPMSLAALLLGLRALPDVRVPGTRFEYSSALLSMLALGLFFLGCVDLVEDRGSWRTAAEFSAALVAGVLLVKQQRGRKHPFLPVDLMRIPLLRLSYATSGFSYAAQITALVALPFYLVGFGFAAPEIGLMIVPWPCAVGLAAYLAGKAIDRISPSVLAALGLATMGTGLMTMAFLPEQPSSIDIGWRLAVCGFGFGFFQTPNNRIMLGSAPAERSGSAGAMLALARIIGQTLGAVAAAMMFRLAGATSPLSWVLAAALAATGAVISARRESAPLISGSAGRSAD